MFILTAVRDGVKWIFNIPIEVESISGKTIWEGTIEGNGDFNEILLSTDARYTIAEYTAIRFNGDAIAFKSDGSAAHTFFLSFTAKRTMTQSVVTLHEVRYDDEDTYEDFDITVEISGGELLMKVKNPDTYQWKVEGMITKLTI